MTTEPTDESLSETAESIRALVVLETPLDGLVGALEYEYDVRTTAVRDTTDALSHTGDGIDCVVVGPNLVASDGLEALEAIREAFPKLPMTLFYEDEETAAAALRVGVDHCIRNDGERVSAQAAHVAATLRQGQRQRTEHTLENETAFVRGALDALEDIFFVFSPDMEFVLWNERLTAVTGYTDAEVAGMAPTDFVAEEHVEAITAAIGRANTDERGKEEVDVVTKSGERIPYEFTGAVLEDEDGTTLGICGIGRDIADRKRRERELERHRRMVEAMGDGMYALDAAGRFAMVNEAFCSMMGYDREELLGEHVSLVTGEADVERGRTAIRELLSGDERGVRTYEMTAHTADGERFPCEIDLTLLFDDGAFSGTVGVARDVTERRSREDELERYETIVETGPVGVFVLDEAGTIVGGNENGWAMGGYETAELMGEPFLRLVEDGVVTEGAVEEYLRVVRNLLSSETDRETGTIEAEITPRNGKPGTYLAHISLLPHDNEFRGTVGVFQDITDRKRRERALEHQAERLHTINRINEIIRDVNQALVRAGTQEEIERAVCANLAGERGYRFAWVGGKRVTERGVEPREWAGVEEGYLDDRPGTGGRDTEDVTAETAIETGEMQVAQSIADDPAFKSWREPALSRGFESAAAIPLAYHGTTYGVLCVYSPRPNAFDETEREVLGELGETIGYAFSAAERRRALVSDTVIELEFALRDRSIFTVDLTARTDCRVTLDGIVERSDGTLVEFVTVTGTDVETVLDLAADRDDLEASLVSEHDGESVFQFVSREDSSTVSLADMGGVIREGSAAEGEGRLVFELPQEANVRIIVEAMVDQYADTELVAQRECERTSTRGTEFKAALDDVLTERQEEVLKTAYLSGFFEWPRPNKGDEIAASLDISGPTFHEHIRTGQRKLLDAFFESEAADGS